MTRLFICLVLFVSSLVAEAQAAITCSNAQTNVTDADTMTITNYTPTAGANNIVIGIVTMYYEGGTVSGLPTFGGANMTLFGSQIGLGTNPDILAYLYYKTGVSVSPQTYSVTFTGPGTCGTSTRCTIGIYTCIGVNQSNPFRGSAVTADAGATQSISVDVPSAVGDLVIDSVMVGASGTGDVDYIAGAGQTEIIDVNNDLNWMHTGSSYEAGAAGNVTMSSSSTDATNHWAVVAGSLQPAAARRVAPMVMQ